jgi:hypothetical protein
MTGDWELEDLCSRFRKWSFAREDGILVASREGFADVRSPSRNVLETLMAIELGNQQVRDSRTFVPGLDR